MSGPDEIERAARLLRSGGVVAVPTETVYGLAADAGNADAVARIFTIKGRPAMNPLIVHAADVGAARRVAGDWPESAERLATAFWPGPLTLVLPRGLSIADAVTAGGDTVAVRVPSHPLALDLLRRFHALGGLGLAAPSANRSEHVSPTTARHVRDDLGDAVDLILDGGECGVGIESTVVSLIGPPTVLRPGGIALPELRAVVGGVRTRGGSDAGVAASPGRQPRHYAPAMPVTAIDDDDASIRRLSAEALEEGWDNFVVLALAGGRVARSVAAWSNGRANLIQLPSEPVAYARNLYAALRQSERVGAATDTRMLFVEMPRTRPNGPPSATG